MSVPFYDVPMLYLVQQDDDTSCWFACFQMMASWKRRILKQTTKGVKGPLEDLPAGALRGAGKGLDPLEAIEYGKRLGLSPLPARSLNVAPETVYRWAHTYGPLYFAYQNFIFGGHVVVIGGTAPKSVIFFDSSSDTPRLCPWKELELYLAGSDALHVPAHFLCILK